MTWLSTGPARAAARAVPTPRRPSPAATSTLTTTSRPSTTHDAIAASMRCAIDDAEAQAASPPRAIRLAAANAPRSAAACARWRAMTAEPTATPPRLTTTSTTSIAAATRVAEPRSALIGFDGGDRLRGNDDTRQQGCRN